MNQPTRPSSWPAPFDADLSSRSRPASSAVGAEVLQARFALRVTAALTERSVVLEASLSERLRFAREQALQRARRPASAAGVTAVGISRSGAAVLGSVGAGWGMRVASLLPVVALVAGLVMIEHWQDMAQARAAAEVDAALLADQLPPAAYSDAGFTEFLKSSSE